MDVKRDNEFLHAQLTIAHWYLDHAEASGSTDGRGRYLAYAREAHEIVVQLLPALNLETEQRKRIGIKVANLGQRLESPAPPIGKRVDGSGSIISLGSGQ